MVREREAARNPLMPSQARMAAPKTGDDKSPIEIASSPPAKQNGLSQVLSPQPEFGRPTALNTSASPLPKSSARTSDSKVIRRSGDSNHSNLFSTRYHKPPTSVGNPLSNIGRDAPKQPQQQSINSSNSASAHSLAAGGYAMGDRTDLFPAPTTNPPYPQGATIIPTPGNHAPIWRPAPPQTFSSNSSTNPYMRPASNFVDLTQSAPRPVAEDGFDDAQVFGSDRFGTADPMMYLDSKQADENIKALLEGAMEEEEDKPRTRRKKKELEKKVDDLTKKMQGMDVKEESKEPEEEDEEDDGAREGLKVKLLPHQIDGVEWMTNKETGTKKVKGILPYGGILADDMGLGKTIQSIALILANPCPSKEELKNSKRKLRTECDRATLVVAPLALIKQWEAEIKDRVEEDHALKVKVHHGPQRTKSFKDLRKYDVVITTYQTLSSEHIENSGREKTALFGVNWYRIVLDEAHSIKNRNAKSTKAACALEAEYRWCLTGTPMQNNLDELQSLIHFLRIKPYNHLDTWREQITKPMNNGRGGLSIRRLRAFLSAFMKRRTKDVLKQDGALKAGANGAVKSNTGFKIVKRTVEKIEAEFNEHEQAFYNRLEARTDKSLELMMAGSQMSYASALVLLMRLRQACNHPQLLGADLSKEQDAMAGIRTPSRKVSKADDMDDIEAMFGGLSVETKRCDICQIELSKRAVDEGQVRCEECEEDLKLAEKAAKKPRPKEKKTVKKERKVNRRVIVDSDDEDDSVVISHQSDTEDEGEQDDSAEEEESGSDEDFSAQALRPTPVSSTKIRHLLKILKHDSHTHKYIVFSFFTSMLDLIEPFLKRHNLKYVRYDGAMRNDAREASLEQLRNNSSVRILLCSLRAGSLGLNLTAASRVVILEPFWNPFVEEQAIDRVHRLNQTQDVVVHKLTIKDSVEARILELQEKKRELAKATIEGQKGTGAGKVSMQEILKLFKHDAERDAKLDMIGMKDGRSLLDRDGQSTQSQTQQEYAKEEARRPDSRVNKTSKRPDDPVYGRRW
ncbi:hypothetical protein LTR70_009966 [Exophiala xenobiotica]|uniref:Uncharacterized protein n=1 Tax=Lithohypha guttulata TaxID=1690604 RepID=A0ABR0K038_9EURO|nr:hypothetical protein LTR24_008352 [Lithohypha guttulata]KAK5309822.1 hypothetical protein LTR70_009966 [Exophiala xenobiotica]